MFIRPDGRIRYNHYLALLVTAIISSGVALCMYYLCNILELKQKIRILFGDIQLDNLEAEEITDKIFGKIVCYVKTYSTIWNMVN
jgi:hypothetical protein